MHFSFHAFMIFLVQLYCILWERIRGNTLSVWDLAILRYDTVLSGKHYNQCWTLRKAFAEATETLFLQKYFLFDVPEELQETHVTH